MFKRLFVTAGSLVVAGAVPAALSLSGASAATATQTGLLPATALAPVTSLVNSVTGSLFGTHAAVPAHPASAAPVGHGIAPASHATGNGLRLNPLDTCISCTTSTAGHGSSTGQSQALRLLGNDLSAGQASSNGANAGSLLALPANPLLGLALADWMNNAQANGITSLAGARSALADLNVANGQVATLAVLEGQSAASYNGSSSMGDGATNGAMLNLLNGGLGVVLLHSESSSDGNQEVYLLSLNGDKLLSSDQGVGGIPINIPGVIDINLLQTGAAGGLGNAALGSIANLLGSDGPVAGVLSTDSAGSAAVTASAPIAAKAATSAPAIHSAAATGKAPSLRTPMTGAAFGMAGFALLFSGASVVMAMLGRRPRRIG
jgi:hypothetical protein